MRPATRRLAVLATLAFGFSPIGVHAQSYPSQDVHFICAFPAGSGADVIVRYFAEKMRPLLNRAVLVENKPGAIGNIATEYVARSRPDGHTVYIHGASALAANMHLFKNPSVDAGRAIQVVATINKQPTMFVVHVSKPWQSVAEVTAYAKERKDKATYATTNPVGKTMGAIYKQKAGLQAVEVNYRTAADSLNDLQSGAIDYALVDNVFGAAQAREGRLRILAVSTAQRLMANPNFPTMTELGYPMDLMGWFAAMVPTATPRPVVDQLGNWFSQVVATDETKAFLNRVASDPFISTPDEAQALFHQQIKDWADYVRLANIEPQG
jgi:tripartite-type tricarboxylate transporter receptor subunit TctC